ncbi:hypothetical protein [Kamptonema formosum]|uniref:hypothetical protein n=1 Tax=Kamptonema formosum TaxID=331992 RepID=UPI00034AE75B|nr:hypothetical protein [Oscillatoria sp. PCC 10802]
MIICISLLLLERAVFWCRCGSIAPLGVPADLGLMPVPSGDSGKLNSTGGGPAEVFSPLPCVGGAVGQRPII